MIFTIVMSAELPRIEDVIDELGGATAVAALTNRKQPAVSNWKARGKFPPETFLVLTQALQQRDKTAPPALWGMDESVPSKESISQDVKSAQVGC